jgi:hypothetical protein
MAGFVGIFLIGVFVAHPKIVFAFFDFISERIPASAIRPPPFPPSHVPQSKRGYPTCSAHASIRMRPPRRLC